MAVTNEDEKRAITRFCTGCDNAVMDNKQVVGCKEKIRGEQRNIVLFESCLSAVRVGKAGTMSDFGFHE